MAAEFRRCRASDTTLAIDALTAAANAPVN
jgi:hypothetical protein